MDAKQNNALSAIGSLFVKDNLLSQEDVLTYQKLADNNHQSLQTFLIDNKLFSATTIASSIAHHFGIPLLDLDCIDKKSIPADIISTELLKKHHAIPLFVKDSQLYVGIDNPSNHNSIKEIQFYTGLNIVPIIVESDKLSKRLEALLDEKKISRFARHSVTQHTLISDNANKVSTVENNEMSTAEDTSVITMVHNIILDAIQSGASDIHFEPYDKDYRVRYRKDGLLYEVANPPSSFLSTRIAARIKVMSKLDTSERRIPQDGRFSMSISAKRSVDLRVSTCPTASGEKIVLRILDAGFIKQDIDTLGFNSTQQSYLLDAISRSQGMILVTGPTGSGKTVTLYTALRLLNNPEINILTAEDPVEIKVPGINQTSINQKKGLTFSTALRSFLRQDPDVIMVGEIRDLETAELAIKASQTGHLVLSTLHTNSASETLARLLNMGIPLYNIVGSVSLIIAQRLVRRLCDYCKEKDGNPNMKRLIDFGFNEIEVKHIHVYKAVGCMHCTKGYSGRIGLYEVMRMTVELNQLILNGGHAIELSELAKAQGMTTIHQSGLQKIKEGITTMEEISRVAMI